MSEKRRRNNNAIDAYLRPKLYSYTVGYAKLNEMSRSNVINIAVKSFFDSMPDDLKHRILTCR